MTSQLEVYVSQDIPRAAGEENDASLKGNRRGEVCVIDFYTMMALEKRLFQVRAGSISAPLVGDVLITDTKAEISVDAVAGLTIIPTFSNICFNLAAATLFELGIKSCGELSVSGTAFVPLPVYMGGPASGCIARVSAAGGVVVSAEIVAATTSLSGHRVHYAGAQPIAAGAWDTNFNWKPKMPPILKGVSCLYVQIGADTTGPSYYATLEYIELDSLSVD